MSVSKEFSGYVCWDPSLVTDEIISHEAVAPSNAVFTATHNPMKLRKRKFKATDEGTPCDEQSVLDDLLERGQTLVLLAIVGESGTGKSHLIRWLHSQLEEKPTRRVVYIKKYNTNLRDVVTEVLRGIEGDDVDQLRTKISRATADTTEEDAAERLIDELALLVSHANVDESQPAVERKPRQLLRTELPKLLRDHVYRSQLLTDTGAVTRLIHEVFEGRKEGDKLAPFEFGADDLPVDVSGISRAGQDAQTIYLNLAGSGSLRQAAAAMMNEALEAALGRVLQIGDATLTRGIIELRRLVHSRDQELVLLIEDFTLLQGIQRGLLEALIEPAVREGQQVLCSIRIALAVTTHYFDKLGLNTVMTRADYSGYVYNVDQRYGSDVGTSQVDSFVARYLNAARVGGQALRHKFERTRGNRQKVSWVPNKCDSCEFQATCHAAFGASEEGFGLYPFNTHALYRMVREVGTSAAGVFEPRAVLGTIVRDTLAQYADDLQTGHFPSASYVARFGVRRELRDEVRLELSRQPDGERLVALYEYWGAENRVADGVFEAFRLRPPTQQPEGQPAPSPTPGLAGKLEPTPVDVRLKAIDDWRSGSPLEARTAREVREAIKAAVALDLAAALDCWRPGESDAWGLKQGSVILPNARGGVAPAPTDIQLEVAADESSASAVRGIVAFDIAGNWAFPYGGDALRNFQSLSQQLASRTVAKLPHGRDPSVEDVNVLHLLLAGGFVSAVSSPLGLSDPALMRAAFGEAPEAARKLGDRWDETVKSFADPGERESAQQKLLSVFGASQGEGRPQVIDAAALLPAARKYLSHWTMAANDDQLTGALRKEVEAARGAWEKTLNVGRALTGADAGAIKSECSKILESARQLQILPPAIDAARVIGLLSELSSVTSAELDELMDAASDESLGTAVASLAHLDHRTLLLKVAHASQLVDRALIAIDDRGSEELAAAKADPAQVAFSDLRAALVEIGSALAKLP